MKNKIGVAITGSFCTHAKIIEVIKNLINEGYDVLPIVSENVATTNTRFGKAEAFLSELEKITNKKVVKSIVEAEQIGPNNLIDLLVVAPCTGNTLSKISNAVTDTAVTMCVKAHLRNNKPVVVGISSNDALGLNLKNLGVLLNTKNVYFIPFAQDNYAKKPKSLIANWTLTSLTIEKAFDNEQLQPVIYTI